MGIPDEESYFWRSYLPLPGGQRGWRRRVVQVAALAFVLYVLVSVIADVVG